MKGVQHDWTALAPQLVEACKTPGGLWKMSDQTGIAYSTLTAQVRKRNLRSIASKRPTREQRLPPSNFKAKSNSFNSRPKGPMKLDPDLPVVIPKGIKVQIGPSHPFDERFQVDPASRPFGAGFAAAGPGRDILTGKGWR